jgi:glycosyltransferase involved in cell wall biosynthesis
MNIAIFSDNFYPEISGISDSIILLGKELSRRGHRVVFVAPRYSKKDYALSGGKSDDQSHIHENIIRLPAIRYPVSPTGQSRIALPILSSLPALQKFKPDIIHSQSPFGVGLEALFISRILGVPLIGTNHTPVAEFMPPILRRLKWLESLTTAAVLDYFSWYYNRCTFVSAPCTALLENMAHYGFRRAHITNHTVPNPIDLTVFMTTNGQSNKDSLKKRFGFSPHTVLYTGRLAPEKGVDTVIRAVALAHHDIPDIMFVATGHGNALNDLRRLSDKLGIADRVQFLGFVADDIYPLIYRASDIFAIMSTAETQSLSLMYAMAVGMPVIGARAWGLPEYIDEGKDSDGNKKADGFLLEPGDAEGLAKILVELFKNPARMAELGHNGTIAAQRFLPATIGDMWEDIFRKTIEKK